MNRKRQGPAQPPETVNGGTGFSARQVSALRRSLDESNVRTRLIDGRELSYIEGWHAIAEANRIFGFERWDRETLESKCVMAREHRGSLHAVYIAKVRITVRAGGETVIREGFGTGEARGGGTLGESHERALKMAETDATKRALATFGKPFGLALYSSRRKPTPRSNGSLPDHQRRRTLQRLGPNGRYYVPSRPSTALDPAVTPPKATHDREENGIARSAEAERPREILTEPAPALQPDSSDQGHMLIEWPKRRRERVHLKFVASQPCLLCGRSPSDAHHLRFAQPRAMGRKVSDEFTVPLCRVHHRQLHQSGNELQWWIAMDRDVDPLEIAKGLWEQSRGARQSSVQPDALETPK